MDERKEKKCGRKKKTIAFVLLAFVSFVGKGIWMVCYKGTGMFNPKDFSAYLRMYHTVLYVNFSIMWRM